jgi:hypothetical protein
MAAARSWTRGKWNPPAVPAGATALSFGVALRADGTVATSRYSLAPVRVTSTRLIAFGALVAAVLIAAVAAENCAAGRPGTDLGCA